MAVVCCGGVHSEAPHLFTTSAQQDQMKENRVGGGGGRGGGLFIICYSVNGFISYQAGGQEAARHDFEGRTIIVDSTCSGQQECSTLSQYFLTFMEPRNRSKE
jgi:hypothetical protein